MVAPTQQPWHIQILCHHSRSYLLKTIWIRARWIFPPYEGNYCHLVGRRESYIFRNCKWRQPNFMIQCCKSLEPQGRSTIDASPHSIICRPPKSLPPCRSDSNFRSNTVPFKSGSLLCVPGRTSSLRQYRVFVPVSTLFRFCLHPSVPATCLRA